MLSRAEYHSFYGVTPGVEVEKGYGLCVIRVLYGSKQGAQRLDVMKHTPLTKIGYTRMAAKTSIYYTLPSSPLGPDWAYP